MGMPYRREIDGLRAIAVSAVVLYHAGIGGAGFVGVDVFFAISGYLITGILLREHDGAGRIDLPAFYARRARRILPAATLVVLATLALVAHFMPGQQLAETARSAMAAAVFAANFWFQSNTGGYFDGASEQMPLLHLWSLSVEEQFYLLWPALLVLLLRRRRLLPPALAALALASFALAQWWVHANTELAFYQVLPRFWELAAGGIVATLAPRPMPRWLAPVSLCAVVAACVVPIEPFPAIGALPAVAASCALLLALHGGARNAVLASAPMVGVGLVSYSLYLWHWPLLAIHRATALVSTLELRLVLCAVAVVLAVATYRYLETPMRRAGGTRVALGAGAATALCVVGIAFAIASWTKPSAADLVRLDYPQNMSRCHADDRDDPRRIVRPGCASGPGTPEIVLWGDSMALAWQPLGAELARRRGQVAIGLSRQYCQPVLDAGIADCRTWNAGVADVARAARIVVLAGRWARPCCSSEEFAAGLERSLAALEGIELVIVLGPTPILPKHVPQCIEQGAPEACDLSREAFERQGAAMAALLRGVVARHANARYLDLSPWFCDATHCPAMRDGLALYWDASHVSSTAATRFAPEILAAVGLSSGTRR